MHKTIAEHLMDKGRKQEATRAARRYLLLLLRKRFGEIAPEVTAKIERTKSAKQLEEWLERFATATTLEEVGIRPVR